MDGKAKIAIVEKWIVFLFPRQKYVGRELVWRITIKTVTLAFANKDGERIIPVRRVLKT